MLEMKRQGIPDHVIMASLRDPRLGTDITAHGEQQYRKDVGGWREDFNNGIKRFGSNFEVDTIAFNTIRTSTPLGKVLETSSSNRTDRIVDFLGNKNIDMLSKNQGELQKFFNDGQKQWRDAQ